MSQQPCKWRINEKQLLSILITTFPSATCQNACCEKSLKLDSPRKCKSLQVMDEKGSITWMKKRQNIPKLVLKVLFIEGLHLYNVREKKYKQGLNYSHYYKLELILTCF